MRIFITGATGLIGRRLVVDRLSRGDEVVALSRDGARAARKLGVDLNPSITAIEGDPTKAGEWQRSITGCDAVINLAGAGVADRRWTKKYKQTMYDSRIESTRHIVNAIAQSPAETRPRVLINGSAIGYYGDRGDEELKENATPGDDFLARLVVDWEHQARRAATIANPPRVVMLRTGVVLDDRGGALEKMVLPFKMNIGGPMGDGRQWMSWIHWKDLLNLIDFAMTNPAVSGPLNAVAPQPQTNREFARTIGRIMHKLAIVPAPRIALRLALGEFANAVLASTRVLPAKAMQLGFQFQFPELEAALRDLLKSTKEA